MAAPVFRKLESNNKLELYYYDGYIYRQRDEGSRKYKYRCSHTGCKATMEILDERVINEPSEHNIDHSRTELSQIIAFEHAERDRVIANERAEARENMRELQGQVLDLIMAQTQIPNPEVQLAAVIHVRKLLCTSTSNTNPPIDLVISRGILPILVNCLESTNVTLHYEAASVLTNIASGTSAQTLAVVQADAVPPLIKLLESPNMNVCEQALLALGNIIGESHFRDLCIESNIVPLLVKFASAGHEMPLTLLHNVTWVLVNLCRHKELPLNRQIEFLLPALAQLIHHQNADILADSALAIYYLTRGGEDQIRMVADCVAIVQSLVPLLGTSQEKVKWRAFCSLGNIFVSGTDEQKQFVINCGLLGKMQALLSQENFNEEATRLLTLITAAGYGKYVKAAIDAGLIAPPRQQQLQDERQFAYKQPQQQVFNPRKRQNSNVHPMNPPMPGPVMNEPGSSSMAFSGPIEVHNVQHGVPAKVAKSSKAADKGSPSTETEGASSSSTHDTALDVDAANKKDMHKTRQPK